MIHVILHLIIELSIKSVKKYKKHAEGTISYTTSPVHDIEYFVNLAKKIEELGSDTLAIKDMASLLTPKVTKDLVEALTKNISIPKFPIIKETNHTKDLKPIIQKLFDKHKSFLIHPEPLSQR